MNILLISQCDKRALTESRRILDQFAERRGERTWQTAITQQGLDTLRRLLRKTARKNSAVACHWIRSMDRSELLWVVGDRHRFNEQGAVPTNTTARNVLRAQDQNDWHSGELIQALTDLAGLLHDLGKATEAFQLRLKGRLEGKNLIRHEWVSLRLLQSFVGADDDAVWLSRLASPQGGDASAWLERLHCDRPDTTNPSPFKGMAHAPLAQALGWLVVSHHRLPVLPYGETLTGATLKGALSDHFNPAWNEAEFSEKSRATPAAHRPFWSFPHGLPVTCPEWQHRAGRVARRLLRHAGTAGARGVMGNPYVLHLARLSLMLADHHYSRLEVGADSKPVAERMKIETPCVLLANTRANGRPNQSLDEHLVGVAQHGAEVARFLPKFEQHLPRLGKHRKLRQRAEAARFQWQNKAADLAATVRERSVAQGAFIVNMASTGCGKTLANARVMYALADPNLGMRCAFAMGLRTLTLQTGKAFRDLLGLDEEELAIRVGGSANRQLFEHFEQLAEASGSASRQDLLEEDGHVLFEGQHDRHPLLRRAVADEAVRKLLIAPLLVCTIDHLVPATESQRGGRQIAPMLRLMSGDLVLDEPDDFDLSDLPALSRLVHWAGLLGSRVLLSSATLPPALVQGLFEAYRDGRCHFQANRGERPAGEDTVVAPCCVWLDEFSQAQSNCASAQAFEQAHQTFVIQRSEALARQSAVPRRRIEIVPLQGLPKDNLQAAQVFASRVFTSSQALHQRHHSIDPITQKRVSFGLVRMANVEPLFDAALALFSQGAPAGLRVHLCVYHSRFPLLIRSAIERQLDCTLQRQQPQAVFDLPGIRQRLDSDEASAIDDHLFIVLGSPVTEVGRDHDYDWAVVEPSSVRSLIQLLGRVRRHREGSCDTPNVHVFSHNLRHFRKPSEAAFARPGFETNSGAFHLSSHDLRQLFSAEETDALDARPRILAPALDELRPQQRLSHLEHARMRATMLPRTASAAPTKGWLGKVPVAPVPALNASSWWNASPQDALLTALLQRAQPFRDDGGQQEVDLVLLPDEEEANEDGIARSAALHRVMETKKGWRKEVSYLRAERSEHFPVDEALVHGVRIEPWGVCDYMQELHSLAESLDMPLELCAKKFGTVSVPAHDAGWRSHPVLGFSRKK